MAELKEKPFGGICPQCDSCEVEFYDTAEDGNSGKYRCPDCGRDTSWGVGKAMTFDDVLQDLQKKLDKENDN
jgi:transposase-like protein